MKIRDLSRLSICFLPYKGIHIGYDPDSRGVSSMAQFGGIRTRKKMRIIFKTTCREINRTDAAPVQKNLEFILLHKVNWKSPVKSKARKSLVNLFYTLLKGDFLLVRHSGLNLLCTWSVHSAFLAVKITNVKIERKKNKSMGILR